MSMVVQDKNNSGSNFAVSGTPLYPPPTPEALTQRAEFLKAYQVEVLSNTEVLVVLPEGKSRYDFMCEAQRASLAVDQFRKVAQPEQLEEWSRDALFTKPVLVPTRIGVNCMVEGSGGMTRAEQDAFFLEKGLTMAKVADLAVAHAAIFLATEFRDAFRTNLRSHTVRARDGQLFATVAGLTEHTYFRHDSRAHPALMAAANLA